MSMCTVKLELPKLNTFEVVRDGSWQMVGGLSFTPIVCVLDGRRFSDGRKEH